MDLMLDKNWTTDNNGFPLNSEEVERYISVVPSENQLRLQDKPFYLFFHFGMNTSTGREWGNGKENPSDFKITGINAEQWVGVAKSSGATGVILTCKHHDGFCLWDTAYTDFSVMNSPYGKDIVRQVADACKLYNMDFGVYLSPWDMHESTYATAAYNDYFSNQLTELLSNYGDIFEVWFDGAKGADAKAFEYDWQRYYDIIHRLQPKANIAICGNDIRWVGNEGGKSRKCEYSVVPEYLTRAESTEKNSQKNENDGLVMKKLCSKDEDLGSRKVLSGHENLVWYPAEVDVSIRKGWFYHSLENMTIKSLSELMNIYLCSVGNNCTLLLNVPPSDKGIISRKDAKRLEKLGSMIKNITKYPVTELNLGMLDNDQGYIEFDFDGVKKLKYCVLQEDISHSQRVEKFDLYLKKSDNTFVPVCNSSVIGANKIIQLNNEAAVGAILVIRQSRSNPYIKLAGFYA